MDYKRLQLRSLILSDLEKGKIRVGDQLPTENQMVQKYSMSRATIREGIALLVQEGVLARKRGSGTFVQSLKPISGNKLLAAMVACNPGRWDTFGQVIQEIEQKVHDRGSSLIVCNHDNKKEKAQRYLDRIIRDGVAGVIFSPIHLPGFKDVNLEIIHRLEDNGIPFVLIGTPISADTVGRYSFVSSNGFAATREIVQHLVRLGHRRIAYIRGFSDIFSAEERFSGYKEEMRRQGLTVPEDYVKQIKVGDVNLQGRQETKELLSCPTAPTAVICIHDMVAKNALEEAQKLGRRVPDDLAVVGFDDLYFSATLNPPLTTVKTPLAAEAALDVEILFAKINGTLVNERQEFLPCRLIIRESCGAPPNLRTDSASNEMTIQHQAV